MLEIIGETLGSEVGIRCCLTALVSDGRQSDIFRRSQKRDSPVFMLAVDIEIGIERENRTFFVQFSHPHQAGVSNGHW